ncbi:hypothetical protein MBLNU230_g5861t1 [Neophaeotheca triangularis]
MVETRSSKRQREQAASSKSSGKHMSAHQRSSKTASTSQRSGGRPIVQATAPARSLVESSDGSDEEADSDIDEDDDNDSGSGSRRSSDSAQQQRAILAHVHSLMSVFDPDLRVPGEDAVLAGSGVATTEPGAAFRQIAAALARASLRDPQLRSELAQAISTPFWARQTATNLRRRSQQIFLQLSRNITYGQAHGSDVHDTANNLRSLAGAVRIIVRDCFANLEAPQRRPFVDILVELVTAVMDWDRDAYAGSGVTRPAYDEERNLYVALIGEPGAGLFVVDVLRQAGPASYRHRLQDLTALYQTIMQRYRARNPGAQFDRVILAWHQLLQDAVSPPR